MKNKKQLVEVMERRIANIRQEQAERLQSLKLTATSATAEYLTGLGADMNRRDGAIHELTVLLRLAHGMNPNGKWPHPEGTCIYCGRSGKWMEDGGPSCNHSRCHIDYPRD